MDFEGVKGLVYQPDFVTTEEHDKLLQEVDARPWRDDLKRRVQHYGYVYDYLAKRVDPSMYLGPLPEFAETIAKRLVEQGLFLKEPDQLIINEYTPGQGIAAHIDCVPCFGGQIATISLGWAYEMDFVRRDREGDEEVKSILLAVGSVAIIQNEARYMWMHRIKARKADRGVERQRRVSLTFRTVKITP